MTTGFCLSVGFRSAYCAQASLCRDSTCVYFRHSRMYSIVNCPGQDSNLQHTTLYLLSYPGIPLRLQAPGDRRATASPPYSLATLQHWPQRAAILPATRIATCLQEHALFLIQPALLLAYCELRGSNPKTLVDPRPHAAPMYYLGAGTCSSMLGLLPLVPM